MRPDELQAAKRARDRAIRERDAALLKVSALEKALLAADAHMHRMADLYSDRIRCHPDERNAIARDFALCRTMLRDAKHSALLALLAKDVTP